MKERERRRDEARRTPNDFKEPVGRGRQAFTKRGNRKKEGRRGRSARWFLKKKKMLLYILYNLYCMYKNQEELFLVADFHFIRKRVFNKKHLQILMMNPLCPYMT